jgi:Domain of unknown function (DUF4253)
VEAPRFAGDGPAFSRRELIRRAAAAAAVVGSAELSSACGEAAKPLPWFEAAAAGRIPSDRRPVIAGIVLPVGRRWSPKGLYDERPPVAWTTDRGVDEAFGIARAIASAFSKTGLWPALWFGGDAPDFYCSLPAPATEIDARKTEHVLREQWSLHPPQPSWVAPLPTTFLGLAKPTGRVAGRFDPFSLLEERQKAYASWDPFGLSPRLLLVPCRHPEDVIATIGLDCGTTYAGVQDPALVSSVLRSWEQRFHAVVVGLGPGWVRLAVAAPPTTFEHALRIAAEQFGLAPAEDAGVPGNLAQQARSLLTAAPAQTGSDAARWELGWDD